QFKPGTPSQVLPAALSTGQTLSVPVTFAPSAVGTIGGEINVTLSDGTTIPFSLAGTGQAATGLLTVNQSLVSLGGTTVGSELSGSATFSNAGATPVTITAIHPPNPPFSASGLPSVDESIPPGGSVTVTLAFDPTSTGVFNSTLEIDSSGGNAILGVSGSAGAPGHLQITSESNDFGSVAVGTTATKSFTITNTGGTTVTISKSKPPFGGEFAAQTRLDEGTTIAPGASVSEVVSFTPTAPGSAGDAWVINSNDDTGLQQVEFTGTGVLSLGALPTPTPIFPGITAPSPALVLRLPELSPHSLTRATIGDARFSFTSNAAFAVKFTLARVEAGRLVGSHCSRVTQRDRHRAECTRYVTVASFIYDGHAGVNRFLLSAHFKLAKLASGTYRLTAGTVPPLNASTPISVQFRIGAGTRKARRQY
ncbi:MAG TPA: choice-of-anchor D domain-containing protein, partial [Solirubrobacteraceae bacterium]|nr:choice-of-anchor D domain-containing protein [Solirubrobacteraceae bacterium]